MASDVTLVRFDVDESVVRWALSTLPGVKPVPADDGANADAGDATDDPAESDGGLLNRIDGRRIALVAGVILCLGLLGIALVRFVKRRGNDTGDGDVPSNDEGEKSVSAEGCKANDSGTRSYPVDVAPVVGMAFLAVAALVVRQFRSSDEH